MAKSKGQSKATNHEPVIENRRARYDYAISDTVDCGIKLTGTEIKSVRLARVNLAEGFARADGDPAQLTLHNVHIGEYPTPPPTSNTNPFETASCWPTGARSTNSPKPPQKKASRWCPCGCILSRAEPKWSSALAAAKSPTTNARASKPAMPNGTWIAPSRAADFYAKNITAADAWARHRAEDKSAA